MRLIVDSGSTKTDWIAIDNTGNITVLNQKISLDMGFGPMDIDIEGEGLINTSVSGAIDLTYSFAIEVIPGFPISESLDCSLILDK